MTVLPRVLAAVGVLALGLGGALGVASPASAASLTVTKTVDDGTPGTLSYELGQLDPGVANTVTITATGPITGPAAGFPTIFDDVTIVATNGPVTLLMAAGGSLNVSGATVSIQDLDIMSATPGSGQGISVLDGSLSLSNVEVRDFDMGVFYVDSTGGNTIDLTDVDAGGSPANPATLGVAIQDVDGGVSLTRTSVSYTAGAAFLVGTGGGTVHLDTVSAEDGSGIQLLVTDTAVTAAHVTTARTLDGFSAFLDASTLDLTDLQVADTDGLGADIEATNGSEVTLDTAVVRSSADSGIALEAEDSTIAATGVTAHDNGLVPGCGCGGGGSGIELYADNSTVTLTGADTHDNTAALGGGIYVGDASNASTVTITGATVTGNSAQHGGGIAAPSITAGAAVTVTGSTTITDNHASVDGGGVIVESLADDGSSFTLSDSSVTLNTSGSDGGGVRLLDIGAGATSTATATIVRTTIDGNTSGGYGAGVAVTDPSEETTGGPTVLIDSSTLSNNSTVAGGGGLYVTKFPGSPAVVKVVNTTIAGNLAQLGGGVHVEVGGAAGSDLTTIISSTTIVGNVAHTSAGIETGGGGTDSALRLENSILADNTSDTADPAVSDLQVQSGTPLSIAYSLVQKPDAAVVVPAGSGNLTGVSPQLAPLANNGGSTKTMLIAPGSPAYNAGNPAFAGAGLFDQRGQARVYQRLDMGAVEWQPALAHTGTELTPGPPLIAFLLLFTGLAMVAFSRLRSLA